MATTQIFDPKAPSEKVTLAFEFQSRLPIGTTISSATVAASVFSGDDAAPSDILNGAAGVSGTKVLQSVQAGVLGTLYNLVCTAVLSDAQHVQISGYLAIAEANP